MLGVGLCLQGRDALAGLAQAIGQLTLLAQQLEDLLLQAEARLLLLRRRARVHLLLQCRQLLRRGGRTPP